MVTKHRSLPDTQTHTNVEWREEADVKPPFTTTPSTALHHSVSTRCLPRAWQPELRRRIIGRQAKLNGWRAAGLTSGDKHMETEGRKRRSQFRGSDQLMFGKNTSKEKFPCVLIKTKWHTRTYHSLSCERFHILWRFSCFVLTTYWCVLLRFYMIDIF